MKILSVDSSSEAASVAILDGKKLLGEMNFNYKKQHSILLMDMIDSIITNTNLTIDDIDAFVVSKGPGSFTGLRIGMASVKAMALAKEKPFIGISSLDGLSNNLFGVDGIICPIMDALRGNVYTALYKFSNGVIEPIEDHMIISIEELCDKLKGFNGPYFFVGDGTDKHKDKISSLLENTYFAPGHLNFTRASSLGTIGYNLLKEGKSNDLLGFAPVYLRQSQAEREYEKKMGVSVYE